MFQHTVAPSCMADHVLLTSTPVMYVCFVNLHRAERDSRREEGEADFKCSGLTREPSEACARPGNAKRARIVSPAAEAADCRWIRLIEDHQPQRCKAADSRPCYSRWSFEAADGGRSFTEGSRPGGAAGEEAAPESAEECKHHCPNFYPSR